jgi:DegV family protein with EDD domain
MSKVAIVTDSTAGFPETAIEGLPIHSVPLQVIWGDSSYQDGIDIQPFEFYQKMETAAVMPSTSQPSPATFKNVYSQLFDQGYEILSVHISSELSGTLSSAHQAREMLPEAKIVIVDSGATTLAMGIPTLITAQAAKDGASLSECKQIVVQTQAQTGIYFAVSTLEFLRRGGRIGGGAAFLGTMLDLKPILTLDEKRIAPVERVRSMNKAINHLINLVEQKIAGHSKVHIGVVHANAPDVAQKLMVRIQDHFQFDDNSLSLIGELSPVIGTHTGPGTIALSFTYEM